MLTYQARDQTPRVACLLTSLHRAMSAASQIPSPAPSPSLARGVKLHLPTGRVVPFLPPLPVPSHGNGVTWGVLGAAGAAGAASVLGYPAARAGAGREQPPPRAAPAPARPRLTFRPPSAVRRARPLSEQRGRGRVARMASAGARRLPAGTRAAARGCCGLSTRRAPPPGPPRPLGPMR